MKRDSQAKAFLKLHILYDLVSKADLKLTILPASFSTDTVSVCFIYLLAALASPWVGNTACI